MPLIDWSQVPTGVVTGTLVEGFRWGIGRAFQSLRRRRGRSRRLLNRARPVLQGLASIASTSLIVVIALTYVQSSAWTNHKQLANRMTQRQTVMLAEAYWREMPDSQELKAYLEAHGGILFSGLAGSPMNALLMADNQYLVSLGLLKDGPLSVEEYRVPWSQQPGIEMHYPNKITPLGIKVICWKLKLPPPASLCYDTFDLPKR